MNSSLTTSVVVPTVARPDDLVRCLDGLARQEHLPDEVVVVVYHTDEESVSAASGHPIAPRVVTVDQASQAAALSVGLDTAEGDIVAITDDDAVPRPIWLALIVSWFERRPDVGGVGGRDWVHPEPPGGWPLRRHVGRITRTGRLVGNHHVGLGPPRSVDFLKGANMAYRADAIGSHRFDRRLRGGGAGEQNDLAFSRTVAADGWTLIYDPAVLVDHYPAKRPDRARKAEVTVTSAYDAAYNETLGVAPTLSGWQRLVFDSRARLLGDRLGPGPLQVFRPNRSLSVDVLIAAYRGRRDARSQIKGSPDPKAPNRS